MDSEDLGDLDVADSQRAMGFSIDRSLEVGKEEEPVLKKGIYKGQKILYVAKFDTIIGCKQTNKRGN